MKDSKKAERFLIDDNLEYLFRLIERDINKKSSMIRAKEKFEEYLHYTESTLGRYGLPAVTTKEIKKKYLKEIIGISFFETYLKTLDYYESINFNQIYPEKKFYDWYNIDRKTQNRISRLKRLGAAAIPRFFTEVTQRLLNGTRKSFGEFYTPIKIAEYLLTSLGKSEEIFYQKKSIIDPACGIGTLLGVTINNILASLDGKNIDPEEFLNFVYEDICGYDIQPFAVILTRLQISAILFCKFPCHEVTQKNIQKILAFPRIELKDSLAIPPDWTDHKRVDFVIANPPYGKISSKNTPYSSHYKKILNGHTNLYQLFLWLCISAVRKNGKIVFLIPQLFTSGLYNQKLRKELEIMCNVNEIIKFRDRSGIFPGVQQPLMIISLSKESGDVLNKRHFISISTSSKSEDIEKTTRKKIKKNRVIRNLGSGLPWCISNNPLDYDILEKVYRKSMLLNNYKKITIRNGGFVWNQNKPVLRAKKRKGNLPLLYASVIKPFAFDFDEEYILESSGKKPFVSCPEKYKNLQYDSPNILIQRTIPRTNGQKIYACMVPQEFIKKHKTYLVENHINVVKLNSELFSSDILFGLTAWLNSSLLNFIFNLMNGNSHISIYELASLPVNETLIGEIALFAKMLSSSAIYEREDIIEESNTVINTFFDLDNIEVLRINRIFQRREGHKNVE